MPPPTVADMAKIRQALRCGARRTDGGSCQRYALIGQRVCWVHGGASPQALREAEVRRLRARLEKALARWQQRVLVPWQAERIRTAARLLGVPPDQVTPAALGFCVGWYGEPEPEEAAPTPPPLAELLAGRLYPRTPRKDMPDRDPKHP